MNEKKVVSTGKQTLQSINKRFHGVFSNEFAGQLEKLLSQIQYVLKLKERSDAAMELLNLAEQQLARRIKYNYKSTIPCLSESEMRWFSVGFSCALYNVQERVSKGKAELIEDYEAKLKKQNEQLEKMRSDIAALEFGEGFRDLFLDLLFEEHPDISVVDVENKLLAYLEAGEDEKGGLESAAEN